MEWTIMSGCLNFIWFDIFIHMYILNKSLVLSFLSNPFPISLPPFLSNFMCSLFFFYLLSPLNVSCMCMGVGAANRAEVACHVIFSVQEVMKVNSFQLGMEICEPFLF